MARSRPSAWLRLRLALLSALLRPAWFAKKRLVIIAPLIADEDAVVLAAAEIADEDAAALVAAVIAVAALAVAAIVVVRLRKERYT